MQTTDKMRPDNRTDSTPFISKQAILDIMEAALKAADSHTRTEWPVGTEQLRSEFDTHELTSSDKRAAAERWAKFRIAEAEKRGHLMTDRQYEDFLDGRPFQIGDYARYIGADRDEYPDGASRVVRRRRGQKGRITRVVNDGNGRVITFRPLAPDIITNQIVELQVRDGTEGFLAIERDLSR